MEAAGECRKTEEAWPVTEFKEGSMETEISPAASKHSSPTRASRKLFSGVVGPLCAWKPPLGTCRKNRSITSTASPKNSNLVCVALTASSLLSPAGASNQKFALPAGEFRTWQLPRVPLPIALKI